MELLTVLATGAMCVACFLLGAKVTQAASKGEKIATPNINPFKAVKEHQERREAEKEQDKVNTILHNIESYNGTEYGQKDVPR